MFNFKRGTAAVALTAAVGLTCFPGVAGAQQDLRNPDLRTPAPAPKAETGHQDLRNADQRGSVSHVLPTGGQDLRNADRRTPAVMPASESVGVSMPPETIEGAPVIRVPEHGFDWGDAGIGAAGGLAIVMLAGAVALLFAQRRRGARVAA